MWFLYSLTMLGCVRSTCAPTVQTLEETEDLTAADVEVLSADQGVSPDDLGCEDICLSTIVAPIEADYDAVVIDACDLELDLSSFEDSTSTAPPDEVVGRVDCTLNTTLFGSETFGSCT